MRKTGFTSIIFLLMILAMILYAGCASGKRGKLVRGGSSSMTFDQLLANWQDYNVYWYGTSFSWVRGILFDPKNDDKVLAAEKWERVENEETLNNILTQDLNMQHRRIRFYSVLGPEDQLFGYLVLTRDHPIPGTRMVDDKTLNVFPVDLSFRDKL